MLLIDSPLLGGWRATALGVVKRTQLVGSISPGTVSRHGATAGPAPKRPLSTFATRRPLPAGTPRCCTTTLPTAPTTSVTAKQRVLGFDRDVETAIYNTLPHNLDRLLSATR